MIIFMPLNAYVNYGYGIYQCLYMEGIQAGFFGLRQAIIQPNPRLLFCKENTMKKLLIAASIALSTGLAFADGVLKPHHGGVMAEATSGNRVELVAQAEQLTVYLSSHDGKPLDSKGVSGGITLLSGTEKTRAALTSAGDNQLTAKAKAAASAKAIVKLTLPGKPAEQVRLTLK